MKVACILEQDTYRPGDPAPDGYLAWHEWAEAQHKAGLRQKQCGRCGLWRYPQELSDQIDRCEMQSRKGPVIVETAVCVKCAAPDAVEAKLLPGPKEPS
jgi:predicted transcriptional regulator